MLRRAIDDVYLHGEDKPNLEIALTKLQAVKKDYQKTLQDIENTLEQDRWGDSLETSTDIRKTGRAMIELADKAIAEAQRKENETAQRDEAAYVQTVQVRHPFHLGIMLPQNSTHLLVFLSVKSLWCYTRCASSLRVPKDTYPPLGPFAPYLSTSKLIMSINYLQDRWRAPIMTRE